MSESAVCDNCIHVDECMERRGQCTEYRNYQDIIKQAMDDIARLNREERCTNGDTGGQGA